MPVENSLHRGKYIYVKKRVLSPAQRSKLRSDLYLERDILTWMQCKYDKKRIKKYIFCLEHAIEVFGAPQN